MRLKRTVATVATLAIITICFGIYLTMDLAIFPNRKTSIQQEFQDNKWLHFEGRLKQLEKDLNKNHDAVGEIKQAIRHILPSSTENSNKIVKTIEEPMGMPAPISEMIFDSSCPIKVTYPPRNDIQMLEMYKDMKFDNPDGGVWKQGWNININENMWNKHHKLKVFVVPHSHNDPGWIKTFEEYYDSQTRNILNNMVDKLPEDPRRKFIWAEISYFSMWWKDLPAHKRDVVKKLIKSNQLEIVTGGWVMNDEANSHWISIANQLYEGHQWLHMNLNYTPVSSWSIDPFGMSATQPVLLKEIGLKNMLIQRVHYSVKKQLASQKDLEFKWRQLWDGTGETEIFTHMMPFYSYDIPHTCGPDPKICCQFDFRRLPNHGLNCPWRIRPQPITDANVQERSITLLDQYRKKSQLYKTNVVLAPLGDDFRYDHSVEWDVQYNNYQKLFDYMNSNRNLHVQAQFGTLTDYFNAVKAEKKLSEFSSLSGDFFTYADRDDHYWSGYYTSRPFYKRMDRILLYYIRSAEILLSLAHISGKPGSKWIAHKENGLDTIMTEARQALALFQHHDGVTGTAKDAVVNDYGQKMLDAILKCQNVVQRCTNLLLDGLGADNQASETIFYNVDDLRQKQDSLPEQYTITIGSEVSVKKVVIYNALTFNRHETVSFLVSTPFVEVLGYNDKRIPCQIAPIFEHLASMSQSKYKVSFVVNIPALSLVRYIINAINENEMPMESSLSTVQIYNLQADVEAPKGFENVDISLSPSEFTIQNARVTASFSEMGLLKAMRIGHQTYPVHLDFAKYGVQQQAERSGAYLFLPNGQATPLAASNTVVKVITGPIYSSVSVKIPYVQHTVTLFNTTGADSLGLEIENIVDIKETNNFELVMRFSTKINSTNEYFTDLNGYQVLRRKRFKKLPLQANYYPIPTGAYIEDSDTRLTLLTGSPGGGASLRSGEIEVMLDRRLMQDDNRGLGQGVVDNRPTRNIFRLLLERKTHKCQTTSDNHPSGFHTISAHVALETMMNPLMRMLRTDDNDVTSQTGYTPITTEFGVDMGLSSLKTGVILDNKEYLGMILHRKYLDICFSDRVLLKQFPLSDGTVNISGILPPSVANSKINRAPLTFLSIQESVDVQKKIPICPMDTKAFLLHR
ncbi:PREDICTED: alpha-mannosidase 2 [Nicrophorus vespilloides]|uniref:Alpha-mannosidase n=1 Tax=Nicrophorus vespilloides TaxID=110193 RepID=A0ABM1MPT1_NICVS|nr:PREDICTED: alpha-mannosidase 2 [Nicrophorus vespilloides]